MTTDYNLIAEEYKRAKLQPWRTHIESFSLFNLLGDPVGKSVLDLACGEGFHTRVLRQKGAARVVGVDISTAMIDLAREAEARAPLGIDYVVGDVKELDLKQTFDVVFAAYLLNYAQTESELAQMCDAIARHLQPGGRFVTVNNNPEYTGQTDTMLKYGFERHTNERYEGAPVIWQFFLDENIFAITNYYLSIAAHERALRAAGLQHIIWHTPQVSPLGIDEFGQAYWRPFLEHPPVIFLECAKA
jgi:ubiquinone/menaquinone biosynthesis C-methylase UbiE